jgi:exodeoxyribonuclease V alpha subunit
MGKTFIHNESNKLDYQMIIVDESSMIDINLASALLRATSNNCSVLFCGDPNQLPSVSCGNFFKDLISSGFVDVFELNKVYRQGKGSDIINFTHQINKGIIPQIENPLEKPDIWDKKTDCLFIESQMKRGNFNRNNYEKNNSMYYGLDVVDMIIKMYTDTIKKYYNELTDYQVIIPMNVGECGTNVVNDVIQKKINPKSPSKFEMIINGVTFRTGDSVIQTVNNYDLQCFNGEIGKVSMINPAEKEIVVHFGKDKRMVIYRKEQVLELKLAYAISIHKSQGSEFDVVIMPMLNIYSMMLYRNLIYTGMTRAKKLLIIIGERNAFNNAVNNNREIYRQTSLINLLNEKDSVENWADL